MSSIETCIEHQVYKNAKECRFFHDFPKETTRLECRQQSCCCFSKQGCFSSTNLLRKNDKYDFTLVWITI